MHVMPENHRVMPAYSQADAHVVMRNLWLACDIEAPDIEDIEDIESRLTDRDDRAADVTEGEVSALLALAKALVLIRFDVASREHTQ